MNEPIKSPTQLNAAHMNAAHVNATNMNATLDQEHCTSIVLSTVQVNSFMLIKNAQLSLSIVVHNL